MIDPVRQEIIASAHTIVIKIGTGVLTRLDASLDCERIASLVEEVHKILETGRKVVIVSSGAIGAGVGQLRLPKRPSDLPHLQAAAAVGQSYLMRVYDESLRRFGYHAAQILLTAGDFENRSRYLNVRNTILTLFDYKAVPIINENDTVSVDEIRFGDNDRLAAMVTNLLRAPLLILMSVVDGLHTVDPGKKRRKAEDGRRKTGGGQRAESRGPEPVGLDELAGSQLLALSSGPASGSPPSALRPPPSVITTVTKLDESIFQLAGASTSELGTGGMVTKLQAARMCTAAGESVLIVGGRRPGILADVLAGKSVGTLFLPQAGSLTSRKRWIGYTVRPRGHYVIDAGARRAVEREGKSLLAIGIVEVVGTFEQGDVVFVCDTDGTEVARGLTNYSAEHARKIKGLRTHQVSAALGALPYDEVIHRDNLVVTSK